jgi:multidrug resistance efflux pump
MITVILLAWCGLLQLLVMVKVFKGWSKWMKLSPIAIYVIANLTLIIPMNFGAPQGAAIVVKPYLPIVAEVSGSVASVDIKSTEPVKAGDVLFTIDDALYRNTLAKTAAELVLAEQRLQQATTLDERGVGRAVDTQRYTAEVDALKAQRNIDQINLDNTQVRAPADGSVPALTLQPGTQLSAYGAPAMSFVVAHQGALLVQIKQGHVRHIRLDDPVEIIFKAQPGEVYSGKVMKVADAGSQALVGPSGKGLEFFAIEDEPVWVNVQLDDSKVDLFPGAIGSVAIYTDRFPASQPFRKLTLRMENWLNYLR